MIETNYIWSRDKLRELLGHHAEEVQSRVACRMLELYPDMRDEMLVYLPQATPAIAFHLLDAFRDLTLPDSAVEPLRKFFEAEQKPADKTVAVMLLARRGQELPYIWRQTRYEVTKNVWFPDLDSIHTRITQRIRRWSPKKIKRLCNIN